MDTQSPNIGIPRYAAKNTAATIKGEPEWCVRGAVTGRAIGRATGRYHGWQQFNAIGKGSIGQTVPRIDIMKSIDRNGKRENLILMGILIGQGIGYRWWGIDGQGKMG